MNILGLAVSYVPLHNCTGTATVFAHLREYLLHFFFRIGTVHRPCKKGFIIDGALSRWMIRWYVSEDMITLVYLMAENGVTGMCVFLTECTWNRFFYTTQGISCAVTRRKCVTFMVVKKKNRYNRNMCCIYKSVECSSAARSTHTQRDLNNLACPVKSVC